MAETLKDTAATSEAERRAICAAALALAQRADAVGLSIVAYLLDTAALHVADDLGLFDSFLEKKPDAGRHKY
jgi:hypothetical protein